MPLPRLFRPALVLLLSPAAAAQAGTGGFQAGDLYLYSVAIDALSAGGGVVHVDPSSGQADLLFDLPTTVGQRGAMCYEPWRDRLLFYGGFVPNSAELWAADAAGNVQSLGFPNGAGPSIRAMAPRGDGLVYCVSFTSSGRISYLDQAGAMNELKDASGTAPYAFSEGAGGIYVMHYDTASDRLVAACYSNTSDCPTEVVDSVTLFALELSADGTRVLGESCFTYEVAPGTQLEVPAGLAQGPNGDVLMSVATNSSAGDARLARIDVGSLSATVYAANDYPGDAVLRGVAYSHVLGKAVILDPYGDVLRAFGPGEVGAGTVVASSGLSYPGISSEIATLIEVGTAAGLSGLTGGPTQISLSAGGTQAMAIDFGPAQAGELYLVLGSASGWSPGLVSGSVLLPLNFDAYLSYTLFHPNAPPLAASLGALDGAGAATCTFSLPAGTDPALAGAVLHHAAAALDASFTATRVSNPLPVALVP